MNPIELRTAEMVLAWREFREAFRAVMKGADQTVSARVASEAWIRMDEATTAASRAIRVNAAVAQVVDVPSTYPDPRQLTIDSEPGE